ncbi:hypothetical protein BaRGS_00033315 [Batillaria attramentaria]|uniref:Uncharacterized protein n=1 Tax=Batillaria attramentaria TaxID=370345 RepID=A0ABD0JKS8_9CAEN
MPGTTGVSWLGEKWCQGKIYNACFAAAKFGEIYCRLWYRLDVPNSSHISLVKDSAGSHSLGCSECTVFVEAFQSVLLISENHAWRRIQWFLLGLKYDTHEH